MSELFGTFACCSCQSDRKGPETILPPEKESEASLKNRAYTFSAELNRAHGRIMSQNQQGVLEGSWTAENFAAIPMPVFSSRLKNTNGTEYTTTDLSAFLAQIRGQDTFHKLSWQRPATARPVWPPAPHPPPLATDVGSGGGFAGERELSAEAGRGRHRPAGKWRPSPPISGRAVLGRMPVRVPPPQASPLLPQQPPPLPPPIPSRPLLSGIVAGAAVTAAGAPGSEGAPHRA